jgi:hypothetical protein
MTDLSFQEYNQRFLEKVSTVAGQAELQEAGRQYVKVELLEAAFNRAIIPEEPITTADCQRNINDQSLYLIRDIEPEAEAVGVDNLGEPDGKYVAGTRYIIPIVNFTTKRFQITVEDLRAYQYKVTKRIEDKSVPVIERLEDRFFMKIAAAAISTATTTKGKVVAQYTASGGVTNLVLAAQDIVKIKNTLMGGVMGVPTAIDTKKKEVACLLMAQETFEYAVVLPSAGDDFGKDRVLNGITSDTLYGTKVIRSIKTDIVPQGLIWAFTSPDFLGHNFALGEPSFEIKANFGLIEWQTKVSKGCNIGNRLSVALLVLDGAYGTDSTAASLKIATDGTITQALIDFYANMVV